MVGTMDFIKEFSQIGKGDAASAGGKGASLGEMTQAGIPVPPGFVILSNAFEQFLEETDLNAEIDTVLHSVDRQEMHTVENASGKIQALILEATMPEDIARAVQDFYKKLDTQYVAVRSSATAEDSANAAWAGQLDSFLNTTEETLLANVQKCWASLFTPRAIFYRFEKELHKTKISVAVVVQKMVQSEVSGIVFSVHPVTEDYNQLIIEAGFGLGEAIVSGSVTPDSYVIEKTPRRIIDKNITYQSRALWKAENGGNEWRELSQEEGSKPALSDEQAFELAEIILRIETHYGFPCDIEWAYEAGHFFITQSRPITTLAPKEEVPKKEIVNAYVGEVGESDTRTLTKVFSRNMPLYAYYIWQEDILNCQPLWVGEKVLTHHLVISDATETTKASVYYNLGQINKAYRLYRNRLIRAGSFVALFPDFVSSFKEAEKMKMKLEKHLSVENLHAFIDAFMHWYHGEMAAVHATPDLIGIDESIKSEALKLRALTQDLTANFAVIVCDTVGKLFPKYTGYTNYLLPEEVSRIETLSFDKMKGELEERKKGWFLYNLSLHTDRNVLDELLHKNNVEIKTEEKDTAREKLVGQIVSKGVAKGNVRIIKSKNDLMLFRPGEILVTEMTYPEYVPQMKIAAGVVTDEGGITCHAAIVSRELSIPCVIGTKIATQVLHDGDLVEVDADKGVVKILEKENPTDSGFAKLLAYLKEHSAVVASAKASFFACDLVYRSYVDSEKITGFVFSPTLMYLRKGTDFWQVTPPELPLGVATKAFKEFLADPKSLDAKIRCHREIGAKAEEVWERHVRTGTHTNGNLLDTFRELTRIAREWWQYGVYGEDKGDLIALKIAPVFETNHGMLKNEVLEAIGVLTHPDELAAFTKERLDFYHLCLHFLSKGADGEITDMGTRYVCDYFFRDTDFFDRKILTLETLLADIRKEVETHSAKDLCKELSDITESITRIKEHKKELLRSFKPNEAESQLLEYVAKTVAWIDERKVGMMKLFYYFHSLLHEIAEVTRIPYENLVVYSVSEVEALLVNKTRPNPADLQARQEKMMAVYEAGKATAFYYGAEAELLFETTQSSSKSASSLSGQVASRAMERFIQGTVRIITDPVKDVFNAGEILVTSMTRIEFVPIMKKAKMIITDEGGIACHAAIVSRELGIPCIIGTKNATRVLHDGDLVEVDADKGVVKILKQA